MDDSGHVPIQGVGDIILGDKEVRYVRGSHGFIPTTLIESAGRLTEPRESRRLTIIDVKRISRENAESDERSVPI